MGDGVLWGASIAPHQVEGGNWNNWRRWEEENADRLAATADDRLSGLPRWEQFQETATDPGNYRSGAAVNHRDRYAEDIALASDLGLDALRTGIEWSRIEPAPGVIDGDALAYYRSYLEEIVSQGMEPIVTLWHYTLPTWFVDSGGWHDPDAVAQFSRYVDRVVTELGDLVTYWVTMNEPTAYIRSYGGIHTISEFLLPSEHLPRGPDPVPDTDRLIDYHPRKKHAARQHLVAAHRQAYTHIHDTTDSAMVGTANAVGRWNRSDGLLARLVGSICSRLEYGQWIRATQEHSDFIGVNHFIPTDINALLPWRDAYDRSDMGWPVDYRSLADVVQTVSQYDLPILITEHGIADHSDEKRQQLIQHAVTSIKDLQDEHDILGYLHWSLLDNFEWDKGFWPRWGLIAVDHDNDLERTPRESARQYAALIS